MSNTSVLTNDFKINAGRLIVQDLLSGDGDTFYMCAGNHSPAANISALPTAPNNDIRSLVQDVSWNMIFGKQLNASNFSLLINNIPWTTDTIFAQYDDNNPNLDGSNYYVMVQDGIYTHVFKCLYNNNNNPSTVQPTFSDISSGNDEMYELSDGYRWKYMYSADDTLNTLFGTATYFPINPNTAVQALAVPGALDVINTDYSGAGYGNWLLGSFNVGDLRINGSSITYGLSSNLATSSVNGYYQGCMLYISTGAGVGQFRNVVTYSVTNLGNFITLDSPFSINPGVNDSYELYPSVVIVGNGTQTSNAVARAIVNGAGNTIDHVEMLLTGQDYAYATANVYANAVVSVVGTALVRPIYSPPGGHGSDPASELGDAFLGITAQFEYAEGNTIPMVNTYRQISLLQDPLFSNVVLNFVSNPIGLFQGLEMVYEINPIQIATGATVNIFSNSLSISSGNLVSAFSPGDFIYFSNGAAQQLTQVNSVINSSALQLSSNAIYSDTATFVYLPQATPVGQVIALTGANSVTVTDVLSMSVNIGTLCVGNLSGALGVLTSTVRSGVSKGFQTFIGNFQYQISYVSGAFQPNEQVFQGANLATSSANALVHSVNNNILLVTQQEGQVSPAVNWVGSNSGAIASISTVYYPEIIYGTSKVLYVENLTPVTRNNQIDTIKLVISLKPL